jgi:16S rRNA (guanine527-N7)-methyltransferase
MDSELRDKLITGLGMLGEDPAAHPCDRYLRYIELLCKWNGAYNLTAEREPERILYRHVLDSLSILPFVRAGDCLDVGSGAGLPGLVLALARPADRWLLLDANGKKVRFLEQAIMELGCRNAEAVQSRIEEFETDRRFATIVSRALGDLEEFARVARLLAPGGVLLAMKGPHPEREAAPGLRARMQVEIHPLAVPGAAAARTLVVLRPRQPAAA